MARARRESGPMGYVICGLLLQALGGLLFFSGLAEDEGGKTFLGGLGLSIGSLVALVGVIALGVAVGIRHSREA